MSTNSFAILIAVKNVYLNHALVNECLRLDGTIAHEQQAEDGDAEAEGKRVAREVNEAYEDEGAAVAERGVSEKKAGGGRGGAWRIARDVAEKN
jgi:hypothetical protein